MTGLPDLVRISRWHLNEKRQKLADLERLSERLDSDLARLDAGIARERKLASDHLDASRTFPAYMQAELQRRRKLEASLADIAREIEAAREQVAEAYRELKKYELAESAQQEREHEKDAKSEQQEMDEIGMQLHRRRTLRDPGK